MKAQLSNHCRSYLNAPVSTLPDFDVTRYDPSGINKKLRHNYRWFPLRSNHRLMAAILSGSTMLSAYRIIDSRPIKIDDSQPFQDQVILALSGSSNRSRFRIIESRLFWNRERSWITTVF
jgi:hypothetical protein